MTEIQKRRILIGLILLSMLPLPWLVKMPTWEMTSSVWLYASAITGYIGVVMLLWMYILGTRTVMGLYFKDLAPVLGIHKWLGKWGTLLIFVHPIATALSYGDNIVRYTLVPTLGESFERSVTWGRFALYAILIVWVSSALVRGRISFRPWKYVHFLSYIALPMALVHIPSIGSSYRALDAPRVYFTSILLLLVLFSVLRLRHLFEIGRSRYTVVRHQQIGQDVWLIALRPVRRAISIKKGQYVYLQWSLLGEEHPFTVLQRLKDSGELTVAYKTVGAWTEKLATLTDGDELFVDGPYGEFMDDLSLDVPQPTVYIAAGIGVTPFVDPILTGLQTDSWLFYANKLEESATFSGQLRKQMGNRFVSILSRENTPASPNDERGHFSVDIIRQYISDPSRYHYYICGSEGFMNTAEKVLHSAGVPSSNVHAEAFGW